MRRNHKLESELAEEIIGYVLVNTDDYFAAEKVLAQQTNNSRYESAMAIYVEYCEAAAPEFKETFDNWLRERLHSPNCA